MNETRFERIYVNNRLKRFKTKNAKDSSTNHIEIYKMLNIMSEDSIDVMKKSNIVNKDVQINDEGRSEIA